MTSASHKLTRKTEQTLLEDIENTGLPLDQVSLVDICDAKEGIYGAPGKTRRPVQLRFQKIKSLTALGYRRLLLKYGITPGPATFAALAQQDTGQDADKELVLSDDEEDEEEVTDDDEDSDIDIASAFGSISIESKSSKLLNSPEKTPTKNEKTPTKDEKTPTKDEKTPTRAVMFSPTVGASPGQFPDMTSPGRFPDMRPTSIEAFAVYNDDSDPAVGGLDFRHQHGTKNCPFIVMADPSHPEQNFPFDICQIDGVEHNDHVHNGFNIRMAIAPPDMDNWKASIPSLKEFPKLASVLGRVIVVKGPSRSYWLTDAAMYHRKGVPCQVTKSAHESADTEIKEDPIRQTAFFLIVFQKGIILDNYIFSSNSTVLHMSKNAMLLEPEHPKNPFTKVDEETKKKKFDVIGVCVWWRIGIAGGKRIRNHRAGVDFEDLF